VSAAQRPILWPILLLIAAAGFALRIAAGYGGLWLDEAWSAVFAREVSTPAGVFLGIHHDNNHHLNTLWLQAVGFDASPVVQRGLSIVSGVAAIVVAGLIGARRNPVAAGITALLFAVSPILVNYGSEARGYAPMVLALLTAILIVSRWLDDRDRPSPTLGLAVVCLLGILGNLTMAFGVVALAGWVVARVWNEEGTKVAARAASRLIALPIVATVAAIVAIVALLPGPDDFHFGAYQTFTGADFVAGLDNLVAYTFGIGPNSAFPLLALIATGLALASFRSLRPRAAFYALAIVGLPTAVFALQLGNPGMPRYYLLSSVALLLLVGEVVGLAVVRRDWPRYAAFGTLAIVLLASTVRNVELILNRRADPDQVVAVIARAEPAGGSIAIDRPRAAAVLEAAAASARYPLAIRPCAGWLFVDRDGADAFPAVPRRCGARYRIVAGGSATGLSGTHWRLYARE